jgi:glycosyltransferase involved in cell wall biosynthesis
MSSAPRVGMVVLGQVGAVMSSQAIRAYELGRALQEKGADVRLFATEVEDAGALELPSAAFDRRRGLGSALDELDVVVAQPQWPTAMRELRRSGKRLIFDLYYPDLLEKLEHPEESNPVKRRLRLALTTDRFNEALRIGHHIICASDKQVDLWLGAIMALGLIDPDAYERDPSMRSAIDAVPFGLPEEPPEPGPAPWGRFSGIEEGDEVVLWNGGIWPWFDAPNAVRAVAELAQRRPRVRLVFMATSTQDLSREADAEARALAAELGVLDRNVFFNTEWVPYAERGPWMTTADCALICHRAGLEARFCFRSRALDCYWAKLPLVSITGDLFSDEIEREQLGATAPPGDSAALAAAIERVLERGRASYADNLERVAGRYRWSDAAETLAGFVFAEGDPPRIGDGVRRPPATAVRAASYRVVEASSRARRREG